MKYINMYTNGIQPKNWFTTTTYIQFSDDDSNSDLHKGHFVAKNAYLCKKTDVRYIHLVYIYVSAVSIRYSTLTLPITSDDTW